MALDDTTCVIIPRPAFSGLLDSNPSLVRGLLLGLTTRLVELTNRLAELTGGRLEPRFARLFLKLASETGRAERGGTFIPLALSRQELADMTGTTVETCIRIMSRWNKDAIVRTEKDGFVSSRSLPGSSGSHRNRRRDAGAGRRGADSNAAPGHLVGVGESGLVVVRQSAPRPYLVAVSRGPAGRRLLFRPAAERLARGPSRRERGTRRRRKLR